MSKLLDNNVVKFALLGWEHDENDTRDFEQVIDELPNYGNTNDFSEFERLKIENEKLRKVIIELELKKVSEVSE